VAHYGFTEKTAFYSDTDELLKLSRYTSPSKRFGQNTSTRLAYFGGCDEAI
jgi:hypothetical protein